jgi:hypothetical protein
MAQDLPSNWVKEKKKEKRTHPAQVGFYVSSCLLTPKQFLGTPLAFRICRIISA